MQHFIVTRCAVPVVLIMCHKSGMSLSEEQGARESVAALIVKIIEFPWLDSRHNLGVNNPDTDGDKPVFM